MVKKRQEAAEGEKEGQVAWKDGGGRWKMVDANQACGEWKPAVVQIGLEWRRAAHACVAAAGWDVSRSGRWAGG